MTWETAMNRIRELEKVNALHVADLLRRDRRIRELEGAPETPGRIPRPPTPMGRPFRKMERWAHDRIMRWLSCEWECDGRTHRLPLNVVMGALKEDSVFIRRLREVSAESAD